MNKFSTEFCAKFFEVFAKFLDDDGAKNVLEMIDYFAAIDSVKKSWKSELSSRFFGRLKFLAGEARGFGSRSSCSKI